MPSVLANQTIVSRDGNELDNPHFAFRRHTSFKVLARLILIYQNQNQMKMRDTILILGKNTRHRPMELKKRPSLLTQHGYIHML
jgi:hypothetical protein